MKKLPPKEENDIQSLQIVDGDVVPSNQRLEVRKDGFVVPIDAGTAFQYISSERVDKASFATKKANAMQRIGTVYANKKHDFFNFNYASVHAIVEQVQQALSIEGLALTVECKDAGNPNMKETTDSKGNKQWLWIYLFIFTLTDCDTGYSESTTIPGSAEDKAPPFTKCMRAAQKAYLTSTFLIPINDGKPPKREEELWSILSDKMKGLTTYVNPKSNDLHAKISRGSDKIEKEWPGPLKPHGLNYLNLLATHDHLQTAYTFINLLKANCDTFAEMPEGMEEWLDALVDKYGFGVSSAPNTK